MGLGIAEKMAPTPERIKRDISEFLMPERQADGTVRISGDGLNALKAHLHDKNRVKNAEFNEFFLEKILEDEKLTEEGRQNAEKMLKNVKKELQFGGGV